MLDTSNQDVPIPTPEMEKPLIDDIENHPAVQEWNKLAYSNEHPPPTESNNLPSNSTKDVSPQRTTFHKCINVIRFGVIVCAFNMGAGEIVSCYLIPSNSLSLTETILRMYMLVFCSITILNELEVWKFITHNALLKNWISRGCFYAFVGILGLEEYMVHVHSQQSMEEGDGRAFYIQGVAYGMVGSGVVYVIMGIMCLQKCFEKIQRNYEERNENFRLRQQDVEFGAL